MIRITISIFLAVLIFLAPILCLVLLFCDSGTNLQPPLNLLPTCTRVYPLGKAFRSLFAIQYYISRDRL